MAINRSLMRQTRRQVRVLRHHAGEIVSAAREAAAGKVLEAADAGQAVIQRAGRRVAQRVAG